jgi:hypothetical protein
MTRTNKPDNLLVDCYSLDQRDRFEDLPDRIHNVPSGSVAVEEAVGAKGIQLFIADGRPNGQGPTVVVPRAFQAFECDGFENQRDQVLAHELQARVVGVDTPGVSLFTESKPSIVHRVEAVRGRMKFHAASQLTAVREVLKYDDDEPMNFIGYSMGAWSVAEMVNLPFAPRIGRVDMVEAVNDQAWRLSRGELLLPKINAEDEATNRYLMDNFVFGFRQPYDRQPSNFVKEKPKDDKLPVKLQSLLLGIGMRRPFAPTLIDAVQRDAADKSTGLSEAPIHFWRTGGSGVARQEANEETVSQLRQFTPEARLTVLDSVVSSNPHRHPIWHSMPAVALIASAMHQAAE